MNHIIPYTWGLYFDFLLSPPPLPSIIMIYFTHCTQDQYLLPRRYYCLQRIYLLLHTFTFTFSFYFYAFFSFPFLPISFPLVHISPDVYRRICHNPITRERGRIFQNLCICRPLSHILLHKHAPVKMNKLFERIYSEEFKFIRSKHWICFLGTS
jgi:hypothetical protein